jgi:galactose-1-phosphate uridylyltransferase
MSELRFHPFLNTWVITATHRQERTFHPPPDYCPLCPTKPGGFPTEIPMPEYDVVVFENRFPSLSSNPPDPAVTGSSITPVRPSSGVCEVVCYSDNHNATLATLGFEQVRKLTRVWRERYIALADRDDVQYVFIFENKGDVIGVTLSHPHGQIYAYPYIPPVLATELESERRYYSEHGRPLFLDWLQMELHGQPFPQGLGEADVIREVYSERFPPPVDVELGEQGLTSRPISHLASDSQASAIAVREVPMVTHGSAEAPRLVWQNATFVAIVPFFARYPYEIWVAPREHLPSLRDMSPHHLDDLAEILLVVTRKYDALFGFSMPYIMAMHQEPAVGGFEFNWFHIEFYPPYRTESKLKYLAGSEAGAGAFINDTLPEETAKRLRDLEFEKVR